MLLEMAFPVEFAPGAKAAIGICLRVEPAEKVTLICDRETAPIAASLARELAVNGCRLSPFVLEDLATRPMTAMPAEIRADMDFGCEHLPGTGAAKRAEVRMQMTEVVNGGGCGTRTW